MNTKNFKKYNFLLFLLEFAIMKLKFFWPVAIIFSICNDQIFSYTYMYITHYIQIVIFFQMNLGSKLETENFFFVSCQIWNIIAKNTLIYNTY